MADNTTSLLDIAWLAGLVEGEGCFHLGSHWNNGRRYTQHSLRISMSDLDVMERAATILGVTVRQHTELKSGKTMYRACAYGSNAISWMMTLYPFMGIRRRTKIREILTMWRSAPGKMHARKVG